MNLYSEKAFRAVFYGCLLMVAFCLVCAILSISFVAPSRGNILETSIKGAGDLDIRHESEHSSDLAMAENASIMYDYSRKWGAVGSSVPEKATSNFIITGGKGGHKTQYAVHGSGAEHKVEYRATKISGDASFASEITLSGNEAGGENFDSVIEFDTLDGNATIQGRVYNSKEGRPATIEELDAVGRYLLEIHLNVSSTPITPDNWLDFCSLLDHDVPDMPDGVYIAPLGYDLVKGKLIRQQNSTAKA